MDELVGMINDKTNYKNLKLNTEYIINYLNNCIENLEIPCSRIKSLYSINSMSVDNDKLNVVKQDLLNKRNYLKNVILVEINKKLNEISDSIESVD